MIYEVIFKYPDGSTELCDEKFDTMDKAYFFAIREVKYMLNETDNSCSFTEQLYGFVNWSDNILFEIKMSE